MATALYSNAASRLKACSWEHKRKFDNFSPKLGHASHKRFDSMCQINGAIRFMIVILLYLSRLCELPNSVSH